MFRSEPTPHTPSAFATDEQHPLGVGRRLVIIVRADPVICGHSGEARNLAEAALQRGYDDVRIVSWPLEALQALPLKPLDSVLPYSPGITVERPAPVGDYKVPDGRFIAGMVGRLVELFTDGVPTVCLSLYLMPHALIVAEALATARASGLPCEVTTMAEAVGSDITNVARSAVESGQFGAAAHLFATYLAHDHCLAVSDFTRQQIVEAADTIDERFGTTFGPQCRERVDISYPAIDAPSFVHDVDDEHHDRRLDAALERRSLDRDGYVLFLSRLTPAKGVDDLIDGFLSSRARHKVRLVIAGAGPMADELRAHAVQRNAGDSIVFFDDVGDEEKGLLMAGCAAYVLASKPRPEFVETFGIALVEKMLAGGGPIITTETGGIPEAVGDTALVVPPGCPASISAALDDVLFNTSALEREAWEAKARSYAMQFDRVPVFNRLFSKLDDPKIDTRSSTLVGGLPG